MFESLFEKEVAGALKALTLEWVCPKCAGRNFRILSRLEREAGQYRGKCRYCRTPCRALFSPPPAPVPGEAEFYDRLEQEEFTGEERTDMIRDFAEIAALEADAAPPGVIGEKKKALEEKIAFAKRRRR